MRRRRERLLARKPLFQTRARTRQPLPHQPRQTPFLLPRSANPLSSVLLKNPAKPGLPSFRCRSRPMREDSTESGADANTRGRGEPAIRIGRRIFAFFHSRPPGFPAIPPSSVGMDCRNDERKRIQHTLPDRSGQALLHQSNFTFGHRGALRIFPHLPSWRRPGSAVESRRGPACRAGREFPKNSIKSDKFTGFFDKFLKINFLGNDAAGIRAQGNSAMARYTCDNGKCAQMRG